jgi:ribosomal protein L4
MLASALNNLLAMKKNAKRYDVLLVATNAAAENKNLFRASSNLQKAKALDAASLNIYDILNHKNLFIDKAAVSTIAKHYNG